MSESQTQKTNKQINKQPNKQTNKQTNGQTKKKRNERTNKNKNTTIRNFQVYINVNKTSLSILQLFSEAQW